MSTDTHEDLKRGIEFLSKGLSLLSGGPFDYYLKKLVAASELLLTRYAPFKVGNRVRLVREQNFYSSNGTPNGWHSCRHFLVPGATGQVVASDCYPDGTLVFFVIFDDETWRDQYGQQHPVATKHQFCLGEKDLEHL